MPTVPEIRIRRRGDLRPDGRFVLYWMTAARRTRSNFGLQRALELAESMDRPLVVLEALRSGYRWASDRLHAFVLQGMRDNAEDFADSGVLYRPYVEPEHGAGKGLLAALAADACAVVTDDFPCFFLPRMLRAAGPAIPGRLELVDSNGLLPLRAADKSFPSAYAFRRFLHKNLQPHLHQPPRVDPLSRAAIPSAEALDPAIDARWPAPSAELLAAAPDALAALPIDHRVAPAPIDGGPHAAERALGTFISERLARYGERNQPQVEASSGLSPYLHFGHVSSHQVLDVLARREDWSVDALPDSGNGARAGWWQMSAESESFLDQLVTWRELGFVMCSQREDYDRYESLPEWARDTLESHANDPREHVYELEALEQADTHDELWNAAQNQLVAEGRMHNYLRMLWGKKILEWSPGPREALDVMIELNNKYALDGRDPNSYSGIFWCLGRYDRAWGPERPIFGKVRYMSSQNTARKLRVRDYVQRWNDAGLFASR